VSRIELNGCATVWGRWRCYRVVDSEEVDFMVVVVARDYDHCNVADAKQRCDFVDWPSRDAESPQFALAMK
jgi:hypothetical protein